MVSSRFSLTPVIQPSHHKPWQVLLPPQWWRLRSHAPCVAALCRRTRLPQFLQPGVQQGSRFEIEVLKGNWERFMTFGRLTFSQNLSFLVPYIFLGAQLLMFSTLVRHHCNLVHVALCLLWACLLLRIHYLMLKLPFIKTPFMSFKVQIWWLTLWIVTQKNDLTSSNCHEKLQ